jgi:hypothetical protein
MNLGGELNFQNVMIFRNTHQVTYVTLSKTIDDLTLWVADAKSQFLEYTPACGVTSYPRIICKLHLLATVVNLGGDPPTTPPPPVIAEKNVRWM